MKQSSSHPQTRAKSNNPAEAAAETRGAEHARKPAERWAAGLPWLGVFALAVLAFANGLNGEFLYDDLPYIVDNRQVQDGGLLQAFDQSLSDRDLLGLYRPLVVLSYQLQRSSSATAMHTFNVLVHAANALLVMLLFRRLGLRPRVAALAAAVFAVHPIHVEPVNWIVGRAELLAALFGVAYLYTSAGAWSRRNTALSGLFYLCACFSKESAMALPAIALVYDAWIRRDRPKFALLSRYGLLALILLAVALLRIAVMGRFGPQASFEAFASRSLLERLGIAVNLLGGYLYLTVLPGPPRIFYHHAEFLGLVPRYLAAVLVFVGFAWRLRRSGALLCCLLAFPLALLPVLNLVPIQETFAERFLYFPSLFLCPLIATLLLWPSEWERGRRGRVGWSLSVPLATLLLGLLLCWSGNRPFQSARALWQHNVQRAPELPFPHYQLAYFCQEQGIYTPQDSAVLGAIQEYEIALRLADELQQAGYRSMPLEQRCRAHLNLGRIHSQLLPPGKRNPRKAEGHLRAGFDLLHDFMQNYEGLEWEYCGLALSLAHLRHYNSGVNAAEAEAILRQALPYANTDDLRQRIEAELQAFQ